MQDAEQVPQRFRFATFELDLSTGELRRRGLRIGLQEQPFKVLALLVERPGLLVTREELRSRLWSNTIVDFDHGINKAINKIREALGDSADNPRFVETIPRRGYRFLADVTPIGPSPDKADMQPGGAGFIAPTPTVDLPAESTLVAPIDVPIGDAVGSPIDSQNAAPGEERRRIAWPAVGMAIALVLVVAASWLIYAGRESSSRIRSLVVLPLESLPADESQEYLADGMTDELITDLGQIATLRVISRTSAMSYKNAHKPLAQIARELNVQAVVEGTVQRSGGRIRVTTQLIRVPDERQLWGQSFEGELQDTLTLQNRIARTIAEQIRIKLDSREATELQRTKAVDPQAYEAYLKGRYFWNKRTADGLRRAIAFFNQAIEADPSYARAYSGLADSYALSGDWEYAILAPQDALPRAKAAATKALSLDDDLGEAHTSLAFSLDLFDWNWKTAQHEFERAIALSPGYATAHHWYAWHLLVMGRVSDGIAELQTAQNLDPLSLIIGADLADALCIAHRYDESIQQSRKGLELDPNFALAHFELGQALVQEKKHDEAIGEIKNAIALAGRNATFDSGLAYAYATSGRKDEALKILGEMTREPSQSNQANVALIYVGLGDFTQAMVWLNKAFEARFNPSILLRPCFDPIRQDPRFQELVRRIGLNSA